jgi:hypothetical protein
MKDVMRPHEADESEATPPRFAQVGAALSDAAGTAATAAGGAASQLPIVVSASRRTLIEANHQIRSGSDELLIVGSALSFGFAMGLLFGGANRLLVAGALLPAASMGLTILERANQGWLSRSS